VQYKSILAMISNEIKCHVNICLGLVGGCIPCIPLCPRLSTRRKGVHVEVKIVGSFPMFDTDIRSKQKCTVREIRVIN